MKANAKKGYKRSVKFFKKFIDRAGSAEVREKTSATPKVFTWEELITLLTELGKKANPPVDKPSDEGPMEGSNIPADGTTV